MNPTPEQLRAIELFATGESLAIEAGAGTGKTSTLVLLAEQAARRRGQYVAFNRSLVEDSAGKFPLTVASNTAHSLAYRAVGHRFGERLRQSQRIPSWQLARVFDVHAIEVLDFEGKPRNLAAGFLMAKVGEAIRQFCRTADDELSPRHFPYIEGLDPKDAQGHRTYATNLQVSMALLPIARQVWLDLQQPTGAARFEHDHYLKQWQLGNPRIDADYILFDEAQDANPVIADIVARQGDHAQLVYVGDSQQEIYAWTGAVNALARIQTEHRSFLTQSFRFGQAIADEANRVLAELHAELRLTGNPQVTSEVTSLPLPVAILTRTNAAAIERLLELQERGRRAHFIGGANDVIGFATAAQELQLTGHTNHPELACFESWDAVRQYAGMDEGEDLALNVRLVDKFGAEGIIRALRQMPREQDAEVVLSTAHKSKGRQWHSVQIAPDFRMDPDKVGDAERRLLYVALTRAQYQLDIDAITPAGTTPVGGDRE